jgi:hypothetical protein
VCSAVVLCNDRFKSVQVRSTPYRLVEVLPIMKSGRTE